jgi:hypothetical protein
MIGADTIGGDNSGCSARQLATDTGTNLAPKFPQNSGLDLDSCRMKIPDFGQRLCGALDSPAIRRCESSRPFFDEARRNPSAFVVSGRDTRDCISAHLDGDLRTASDMENSASLEHGWNSSLEIYRYETITDT